MCKVRYVDGGPMDSSGRCRWVYGTVNGQTHVTYKGYTRKVEDTALTLYPHRIFYRGIAPADKHVISIFDLERK